MTMAPRTYRPFGSSLSRTPPPPHEQGFSLIEALVALLILGVAAAGLVRAVESHIDSIARLEQRAAAVWVAENRLTELTLADRDAEIGTVEMLGRRWQVRTTMRTSPDPALSRVDVAVGPPGGTAMVTIGGFVDRGPKIAPLPVPQS